MASEAISTILVFLLGGWSLLLLPLAAIASCRSRSGQARRALSEEEQFRRDRLRRLVSTAGAEASVDDGQGSIVMDENGRCAALGWGWEEANDVRLDCIKRIERLPPDPVALILDLPAPWQALIVRFEDAQAATQWKARLEAIVR